MHVTRLLTVPIQHLYQSRYCSDQIECVSSSIRRSFACSSCFLCFSLCIHRSSVKPPCLHRIMCLYVYILGKNNEFDKGWRKNRLPIEGGTKTQPPPSPPPPSSSFSPFPSLNQKQLHADLWSTPSMSTTSRTATVSSVMR